MATQEAELHVRSVNVDKLGGITQPVAMRGDPAEPANLLSSAWRESGWLPEYSRADTNLKTASPVDLALNGTLPQHLYHPHYSISRLTPPYLAQTPPTYVPTPQTPFAPPPSIPFPIPSPTTPTLPDHHSANPNLNPAQLTHYSRNPPSPTPTPSTPLPTRHSPGFP
jgi:hypothetical protein